MLIKQGIAEALNKLAECWGWVLKCYLNHLAAWVKSGQLLSKNWYDRREKTSHHEFIYLLHFFLKDKQIKI